MKHQTLSLFDTKNSRALSHYRLSRTFNNLRIETLVLHSSRTVVNLNQALSLQTIFFKKVFYDLQYYFNIDFNPKYSKTLKHFSFDNPRLKIGAHFICFLKLTFKEKHIKCEIFACHYK